MNLADIKSLSPGIKLWDDKVKGLFAFRNSDNSISFFINYRTRERKQRRVKVGRYGALSLDGARKVAQELLSKVALGEDPAKKWKDSSEELTVHGLMVKALKEYWSAPRFVESRQFKNVLGAVRNDFAPIAKYKLSELTTAIITRWHKKYAHKPSHGNHLLAYLTRAFNWARENQLINLDNPCSRVKRFPRVKRDRFASIEEIQKIGRFLEKNFEKEPLPSIYLYLILTTGTRPSAISRLEWKNLIIKHNPEGKEIGVISFFGKTSAKTGENETIIIPPKTLAMIKRLPQTSDYIVPCNMPSKLWQKIKNKFNCPDLWARDLRRTYATVGLSNGVSLSQVGELLNHRCWDTTKIYAKLMMNQRINSAMTIANKIEDIIQH